VAAFEGGFHAQVAAAASVIVPIPLTRCFIYQYIHNNIITQHYVWFEVLHGAVTCERLLKLQSHHDRLCQIILQNSQIILQNRNCFRGFCRKMNFPDPVVSKISFLQSRRISAESEKNSAESEIFQKTRNRSRQFVHVPPYHNSMVSECLHMVPYPATIDYK
jgi:hypothetical protein